MEKLLRDANCGFQQHDGKITHGILFNAGNKTFLAAHEFRSNERVTGNPLAVYEEEVALCSDRVTEI